MVKKKKPPKRPTLILEGCDGVGKTQLAHEIQKLWGCKYIHVVQAPKGADTLVCFLKAVNDIKQPTIIDRLHWSEEVYAKILREDSLLSDRDFGVIDGYLLAHRGIFVHCNPPWEEVEKNILKDPDGENHNLKTAKIIHTEYQKFPRTILPIVTYDYTKDDLVGLLEKVQNVMIMYYGK